MENIFETGRVILINKPYRWTSAMAVRKVRDVIDVKVGHAGTLDPLATGLLILCSGKFTKKINDYMMQEKEYTGSFTLGATTPSYDLEQEPENLKPFESVDDAMLRAAVAKFTGAIDQIPPAYSAIKKNGKRAYELARQGISQTMVARRITIREFTIDASNLPVISFRVVCSTGTYIRSLAHDMGETLGCGAYLSSLCRTRIGNFTLDQAIDMENLEAGLKAMA